jgi:hypothetical protein
MKSIILYVSLSAFIPLGQYLARDQVQGGVRHKCGVNLIQALAWNVGDLDKSLFS